MPPACSGLFLFCQDKLIEAGTSQSSCRGLQDKVAEVQNEIYGYGDRELLKVSGPDFDTRL